MPLIQHWIGRLFGLFLRHPFVSVACVVFFALGLVLVDRLLFPPTRSLSAATRVCKELLGLFLHVPVAIVLGGAFVFVTDLVLNPFSIKSHLPELLVFLFGSIFWGALLGFVVCQFARHRSARWVGAIGLLYLLWSALGILASIGTLHTIEDEAAHFDTNSNNCLRPTALTVVGSNCS
jgi:hypothetical protein